MNLLIQRKLLFILLSLLTTDLVARDPSALQRSFSEPTHDQVQKSPQDLYADLMSKFLEVSKPRYSNFLHQSLRHKKYEITEKDLKAFKKYTASRDVRPDLAFDMYIKLIDKVNWIDGFNHNKPQAFQGVFYADKYFKSTDSVVSDILEHNKK